MNMMRCVHCGELERWHHTGTRLCPDMKNKFEGETYTVPKPPPAHKEQVGGDHYKKMSIQPIEYIMANKLGYCEGNIVKYISRWRDKGGVEDLRKIKQYVDFLIEQETK